MVGTDPFNVAARPAVAPYRQTATKRAPNMLARAGSLASVKVVRFNVVTDLTL
jgi:hypothetical protein